ncbi:Metal-dependent hydrolase, endonuclease/exonuclease/phosphatase family [Arthrobacter crystallopoietes]|uniref:Metal-dependent hydrolase, endonuclease/exonuclease/phosphatase family n=1 Tax=Crystallibacter crystallopoietes TaxID=37928 RepID=A0A1H1GL39_9MICC|nr:hypothetical protein AC20117_18615 [Arthrobacter crystallopoietes]SDR13861.1 Metal-dependent hydrolase, endonuclease/exonuclease/phosphatase family [Arthrobacter crystallopoietes]
MLLTTSLTAAAVPGTAFAAPAASASAVAASKVIVVTSSQAPLPAPKTAAAPGYNSMTLVWPAFGDVGRWEVRYGTRADFVGAKIEEKVNSRWIGGLTNATTYYIQYRALTPVKGQPWGTWNRSPWSATLKTMTGANYPGAFTPLKTKGGTDSITVSWNKTAYTTHYTVLVADNMAMTLRPRTYRNITGTSFTIKNLTAGSRSSYPTFIRVQAHNKTFKTRTSSRITAYPAAPGVRGTETLTVASQNLLCASCKLSGISVPHWNTRKMTHLRTIKAKNPDVLLLQEALNVNIPGTRNTKAMTDFQGHLKKAGYALDRTPEKAGTQQYVNRIAYKTSKYTLLKRGTFALPVAKGEDQRGAAWALLKSKKTGKQFYAVSFHVSPKLPVKGAVSKTSTMQLIEKRMKAINIRKLPVVSGGDMNSSFYVTPSNLPHEAMIKAGWTDTASSAAKTDFLYPTTNSFKKQQKSTFGRIDYIFTKNIAGTVSYENVLDIDRNGRLRSTPASDHNMVLAKVKLK